ncbi:Hypothetical predicted protein [Paramuricea clavata]|uniref:Uncharacterized protein n=1 Tax=Paramuricea clavata TaxID=317549 RepID=A0A7D9EYT0_PARCT|nr:Hypothetical predicted protein [Paramuricea clavata]
MPSTVTDSKKPCVLLWRDLDVQQLHVLKESTDKLRTLAEIFSLTNHKDELKSAVLLDLYFYTLQYPFKQTTMTRMSCHYLLVLFVQLFE